MALENKKLQGECLMRRRDFVKAAIGTVAAAWPISSHGETFPSRQITLIVPFAAGGPTDVLARILAEQMRRTLGQTVVIENVAGASGTLAGIRVARAAPDGFHIIIRHLGTPGFNRVGHFVPYHVPNHLQAIRL